MLLRHRLLSLSVLVSALFGFAFVPGASAGDIVGRVELTEKGGKKADDLSDVVVYLESARGKAAPGKEVVRMKSKTFLPHVIAVAAGDHGRVSQRGSHSPQRVLALRRGV
jgi:hypothetical protein